MIDYDKPGYCAKCHTEVAYFDGPKIVRLKGNYRQAMFDLDDGSQMPVALCAECFDGLKAEHTQEIMDSVVKGWQAELDQDDSKTKEEKDSHMSRYAALSITQRLDKPFDEDDMQFIMKPVKVDLTAKEIKDVNRY